jgi:3-oxoacyl-[acyl-carrier-protein] synthase II
MIRGGEAMRVIVVAAESSLHPLFVASFKRLGVIAPPGHGCRPFDQKRAGFLMSEAAAAICLEANGGASATKIGSFPANHGAEEVAPRQGGALIIDRFAMAGDATHLTTNDPEAKTLRRIFAMVCDAQVDLVHAHGTGTTSNDPVELAAIESGFCDAANPPAIYSHKAALGHSMGAAGLLSICINCMAHQRGFIPANVQTRNPLPTQLPISSENLVRPIRRSIALAAGFGGPMAAVGICDASCSQKS